MKTPSKIFICISSVFAVLACLAGVYPLCEIIGNNNNAINDTFIGSALNVSNFNIIDDIENSVIIFDGNTAGTGSDKIVDTCRDENDNFSLWKEEFYNNNLWEQELYNCLETMMSSIELRNIVGKQCKGIKSSNT